ncbi:MAG: hypothetical protein U0Z26_13850 [Anaerolineales bacterium]
MGKSTFPILLLCNLVVTSPIMKYVNAGGPSNNIRLDGLYNWIGRWDSGRVSADNWGQGKLQSERRTMVLVVAVLMIWA